MLLDSAVGHIRVKLGEIPNKSFKKKRPAFLSEVIKKIHLNKFNPSLQQKEINNYIPQIRVKMTNDLHCRGFIEQDTTVTKGHQMFTGSKESLLAQTH